MLFRAFSESMICCRAPWIGAKIDDAADVADADADEIASTGFEERIEDSSEE